MHSYEHRYISHIHTHQAPTLHTNICTIEKYTDIYKVHTMHICTRYKCYTVHTQAQRTHTQWAQTCTPFTFMHTETHAHTHSKHHLTHPCMPNPQLPATHSSVVWSSPSFPFSPTCPLSRSFFLWQFQPSGHSEVSPAPPQTDSTLRVECTYCFLCLFSSFLLLFGLEELSEKWPIN